MVKEEKVYKCKTCGREFKSSPALSAHVKKHKREEEGAKTEELRTIPNNSNLTQIKPPSNTIQPVIPSPIPQQPLTPPNPYDFLIITNYQQQQQPRQQTSPSCPESLIRIFSSPAGAEIVKLIRDLLIKKDDESSKLLYNLMYDSFNTMWSVAKTVVSNLVSQNTRACSKDLESYYKEFYKKEVIIYSEKLEVLQFPSSKPLQPVKEDGVFVEEDVEDGVFIQ